MFLLPCFLFLILNAIVYAYPERPITYSLTSIYTEISTNVSSLGFSEFTSSGLLDNSKVCYYDSETQVWRPDRSWVQAGLPDYTKDLEFLRNRFRHYSNVLGNCTWPCPDLHVLQRRYGCEVQKYRNGSIELLRTYDEYGYDGEDFLTFDTDAMQWKGEVPQAQMTKKIWDNDKGLKEHTRFYLLKECVYILDKLLIFRNSTTHAPPDVYAFVKKSVTSPGKLTLTCLVTGFYSKDVMMSVRKYRTSLPEDMLTSSGVRPNDDDTYQLRKSVEILENEESVYDCYVTHSSLTEPAVTKWDGTYSNCSTDVGGVTGAKVAAVVAGLILVTGGAAAFLIWRNTCRNGQTYTTSNGNATYIAASTELNGDGSVMDGPRPTRALDLQIHLNEGVGLQAHLD